MLQKQICLRFILLAFVLAPVGGSAAERLVGIHSARVLS